MNKEVAIKQLEIILQNIIEERKQGIASIEGIKFQEALQTVLNLIEKQSKEIEELKDKNKSIVYNYEMVVDKLENSTPNDKIKAKIEEIDIEIQCCEYADDDTEEYKQDIEKEKRRLLRDKAVLQSLLEKE